VADFKRSRSREPLSKGSVMADTAAPASADLTDAGPREDHPLSASEHLQHAHAHSIAAAEHAAQAAGHIGAAHPAEPDAGDAPGPPLTGDEDGRGMGRFTVLSAQQRALSYPRGSGAARSMAALRGRG